MTGPGRCPVVHFDHNSQDHSADPVGSYRALRESAPVAWTPAHGGYWVLSDYAAVFAAARDDAVFSSARSSHGGDGLTVVIPKTPHAPAYPDRDRSARVPQIPQRDQPDRRAGRGRTPGPAH